MSLEYLFTLRDDKSFKEDRAWVPSSKMGPDVWESPLPHRASDTNTSPRVNGGARLFFARAHKQTVTLAHAQWPALVE